MSHRIKNLFAIAGSIVALSARDAATPEALARSAGERLAALGRAHDLTLTKSSNEDTLAGPKPTALHALIKAILSPFANSGSEEHANIIGADIPIDGNQVTALALIFHEFAIKLVTGQNPKSAEGAAWLLLDKMLNRGSSNEQGPAAA
jgi:two-component sensor histidine kinase